MAEGAISPEEYMVKLDRFVAGHTAGVKRLHNQYQLRECYDRAASYHRKSGGKQENRAAGKKKEKE